MVQGQARPRPGSLRQGHRRKTASLFESEKTKPDQNAKPEQKVAGKTENKKAPGEEKDKAAAKTKSRRDEPGPFIDKQLDKALEILRAKLAETTKKA